MYTYFVKPLLDFFVSILALIILSPIFIIVLIFLIVNNRGRPFFIQKRPGKNEKIFEVIKFKTMNDKRGTNGKLLPDAKRLTKVGAFIRKTSLDEIPQLINVLKGNMSLVGPRPGLFNQIELTQVRDEKGVFKVRPGLTGLAQVQGIDMSTPEQLAETDAEMIAKLTIRIYFQLIVATVFGHGQGDAAAK